MHVRQARITKRCRAKFREYIEAVKDAIYSVENGDWWFPCDSFEYKDIEAAFEKGLNGFFHLPKLPKFEIAEFRTDIVGYDKGRERGVDYKWAEYLAKRRGTTVKAAVGAKGKSKRGSI